MTEVFVEQPLASPGSAKNCICLKMQNMVLLYKHIRHPLTDRLSHPLVPTALQRRHAQTVRDSSSSYKICPLEQGMAFCKGSVCIGGGMDCKLMYIQYKIQELV